jgi:hypothetical protein
MGADDDARGGDQASGAARMARLGVRISDSLKIRG